jgi:hypothetical protein
MASTEASPSNTVCIGIDFAWWGGLGRGDSTSCADIIIGQQLDAPRLWYRATELRKAPNPLAHDPCEPNYDADATIVTALLSKELERLSSVGTVKVIVAIDAPVATSQQGLPARRRALQKGDKGGIVRRSCETQFLENARRFGGPWGRAVSVQPGAPLAPRISRFVDRLTHELGFVPWNVAMSREELPERTFIEVLPIEAIWSLGVTGCYGDISSESVTRYRSCERCLVSRDDAMDWARWPLQGFVPLLGDDCDARAHVETITRWVGDIRTTNGTLKLTKRYVSLVDAGLSWLTALAFRYGRFHAFTGSDRDGCLVGPGILPTRIQCEP